MPPLGAKEDTFIVAPSTDATRVFSITLASVFNSEIDQTFCFRFLHCSHAAATRLRCDGSTLRRRRRSAALSSEDVYFRLDLCDGDALNAENEPLAG